MDLAHHASAFFRTLLLPPAGLFVLLAIGTLLGRFRARAGRIVSRSAIVMLFALCTPAGADLLVAPLEALARPLPTAADHGAQAIVVLAAGRMENAPEYGNAHVPDYIALARLRYGAKLQHETGLPLLVTGGNRADNAPHEAKASDMARALQEDFRTTVTWIETRSETTAQNAAYSAAILKTSHIQRILLVTDAMHMPRAQAIFTTYGLQVVPAPTVFLRLDRIGLLEFVPDAESLRRSYYATYEWIGLIWYRLRF